MKRKYFFFIFFLFTFSLSIHGCKSKNKKKAYKNCKDSVLMVKQKYIRAKGKVFLDYNFGNTLNEFNGKSFLLRQENKIDDMNHYKFEHPALNVLDFTVSPDFHNDSLKSISLYNWDRYGKDGEQTFFHLSVVLTNKFDEPVCECEDELLWIKDERLVESSFDDKRTIINIEDLSFARYHHQNFTKVKYSEDINTVGDTYDMEYFEKYVKSRKAKIQKAENDKASKDL